MGLHPERVSERYLLDRRENARSDCLLVPGLDDYRPDKKRRTIPTRQTQGPKSANSSEMLYHNVGSSCCSSFVHLHELCNMTRCILPERPLSTSYVRSPVWRVTP